MSSVEIFGFITLSFSLGGLVGFLCGYLFGIDVTTKKRNKEVLDLEKARKAYELEDRLQALEATYEL